MTFLVSNDKKATPGNRENLGGVNRDAPRLLSN